MYKDWTEKSTKNQDFDTTIYNYVFFLQPKVYVWYNLIEQMMSTTLVEIHWLIKAKKIIFQSIMTAVTKKMKILMTNKGLPGRICRLVEITSATTPIPPFETPLRINKPIPIPKKIEPNTRSYKRTLS